MCQNAQQHKQFLREIPHLKTLTGPDNRLRRNLRKAHRKQGGECIWCNTPTFLWWEVTNEQFIEIGMDQMATREHMVPKSKGGLGRRNISCACHECNNLRGAIDSNAFKWVSSDPARFERFKELKNIISAKRKARREEKRRINNENCDRLVYMLAILIRSWKACQKDLI